MIIYVAGSSSELDRAEDAMLALERAGHTISHDWVADVRRVGSANPPDSSRKERLLWARGDLSGVERADVFWLLMPASGGFGAGVELGYAIANSIPIVVSGPYDRSIFTAFAYHLYNTDDVALHEYFKESE